MTKLKESKDGISTERELKESNNLNDTVKALVNAVKELVEGNKQLRKNFKTLGEDVKRMVGLQINNLKQELRAREEKYNKETEEIREYIGRREEELLIKVREESKKTVEFTLGVKANDGQDSKYEKKVE